MTWRGVRSVINKRRTLNTETREISFILSIHFRRSDERSRERKTGGREVTELDSVGLDE